MWPLAVRGNWVSPRGVNKSSPQFLGRGGRTMWRELGVIAAPQTWLGRHHGQKKWTLHRQQPLSVSHSLFLFACLPPPPSPRSVTLLDHVIMSCLCIRAEILRMPPSKSNRLMGRDFLYVSQNSSKLEQEFFFLSCCNCTKNTNNNY